MSGRALEGEPRLDREVALLVPRPRDRRLDGPLHRRHPAGELGRARRSPRGGRRSSSRGGAYAISSSSSSPHVGTKVLTEALKWGFKRDRPAFPDPLATESSYSFPSGHASMSMAVYGSLAIIVVRRLDSTWQRVAVLIGTAVLRRL